jgi:hypothetical protein
MFASKIRGQLREIYVIKERISSLEPSPGMTVMLSENEDGCLLLGRETAEVVWLFTFNNFHNVL